MTLILATISWVWYQKHSNKSKKCTSKTISN
jgi:hypothetical protein